MRIYYLYFVWTKWFKWFKRLTFLMLHKPNYGILYYYIQLMIHCIITYVILMSISNIIVSISSADPEGVTGGPDPPGKSQVIWVSIGNKQLDPPPPPWKKLVLLWKMF